jgi:DNA sulfur modification protein DndB
VGAQFCVAKNAISDKLRATMTNKVEIVDCDSFDTARNRASEESSNSSGSVYPVVVFRQGARTSFAGAMAIRQIAKHVSLINESKKGDSPDQVLTQKNRPIMPDHVAAIANYLSENAGEPDNVKKGRYILPPVSWNVKEHVRVYTGPSSSSVKIGYLVLPDTASLEHTDGQHRIHAALQALAAMSDNDRDFFALDAIPFMIVCEEDVRQIHQDFADAAKTRAIPPSLLTVYDLRQPVNKLVIDLIERCPVFRGKIDSTSKALGKNSLCLFLTNQIRQLCRAMLVGDVAMAEGPFLEKAKQLLPNEDEYQNVLDKFVSYINLLAENIPDWKEAAGIQPGHDLNRIKNLRVKPTLAWSATGLNIIGRLAYDLFMDPTIEDWRPYAERIGRLNFNKSNSVWRDVLTLKKNKSSGTSQRSGVR